MRSSIQVQDSPANRFAIIRAVVIVRFSHGAIGDLRAMLKAPGMQDAEALELFTNVGGTETDMNILLYDEAPKPITRLQLPDYFGLFRPQVALSALNGRFARGTWELQIRDTNDNGVNGVLTSWELRLCTTLVQNPATVGVFRPSAGLFYLRNQNTSGPADLAVPYGAAYDSPVTGDWNDDGVNTIGVYRNPVYFLRNSNTPGPADVFSNYGEAYDLPITGDWDGYSNTSLSPYYGKDTIGVFRGGGWLLRNRTDSGVSDLVFSFGISGDKPVAGDWTGHGYDSIGVFRNGAWYLRTANTNGPPTSSFCMGRRGTFRWWAIGMAMAWTRWASIATGSSTCATQIRTAQPILSLTLACQGMFQSRATGTISLRAKESHHG